MQCKFLDHGLAISYDHIVKPCCAWDTSVGPTKRIESVDLTKWHSDSVVSSARDSLLKKTWPIQCHRCETLEASGRWDSMRGNGNKAYKDFSGDDIVLEIRPGSICNFACQTCWPEASTRVADFYHKAGFIDIKDVDTNRVDNFDHLLSIAHRIKKVILLGGEPFFDPNCQSFLAWASEHLDCEITMFTNGSQVNWSWVESYQGRVTLVFSLDAVGTAAEYVRFGTIWAEVLDNFNRAITTPNLETRVHITSSIYNYFYLHDLIDFLLPNWPAVVSFGQPDSISYKGVDQGQFDQRLVPEKYRQDIVSRLTHSIEALEHAPIELGQKHNAQGALKDIIHKFSSVPYDAEAFERWRDFVTKMDAVKHTDISDFCPELADLLTTTNQNA